MVVKQNDIKSIEFTGNRVKTWLLKHLLKNVTINVYTKTATSAHLNFDGREPGGWGSLLYMYKQDE